MKEEQEDDSLQRHKKHGNFKVVTESCFKAICYYFFNGDGVIKKNFYNPYSCDKIKNYENSNH